MKNIILALGLLFFTFSAFSQSKPAYVIYTAQGKKVSYKKMLKKLIDRDIVLFGELHNNSIAHWLQYEFTADVHQSRELILGAEMFEADNQEPLTDYINGDIDYDGLDTLARLWSNYKTDYAPLVDFAKEEGLTFIATNIPRRYANLVYREGFGALDALTDEEKSWMAPLPMAFDPELPTYKEILVMMGDHGTPELVEAQSTKDATMAHFILQNYQAGKLFLHYNGAYHSDSYEGILWYLKNERSALNYGTISTVVQEDVHRLLKEHKGKADFIICVDSNMTTTY